VTIVQVIDFKLERVTGVEPATFSLGSYASIIPGSPRYPTQAAHIVLPWIHRLFSNLKRWGLGVYHGLRKTNLQHYLDEFVFRFNRRRTRHAAFDTLLGIGTRTAPAPYHVLIRKAA